MPATKSMCHIPVSRDIPVCEHLSCAMVCVSVLPYGVLMRKGDYFSRRRVTFIMLNPFRCPVGTVLTGGLCLPYLTCGPDTTCYNGGSCTGLTVGGPVCLCPRGYTGHLCQTYSIAPLNFYSGVTAGIIIGILLGLLCC